MNTAVIVKTTLSSLVIAFTYDKVSSVTGVELRLLPWLGLAILIGGLWYGLYANDKETKKEEA